MTPACTTFVVRSAVDRTRAIALLTDSQVDFEPEGRVMSTLLDSFDGRLHRAGVHLDLDELPGRTLALSRGSTSVAITVAPRFAGDVIPELAGGISAALGPRRLLPRLRRSATRTVGIVRAGAGDSRMTVTLHERIRVLDPVRRSLPGALIEVCPVRGPSKAAARVVRARDARSRTGQR